MKKFFGRKERVLEKQQPITELPPELQRRRKSIFKCRKIMCGGILL